MASVLDLVKHYQHAIEKYPNDEQKILKCIDKLFHLDVTVQHLQETGVGRTVNALRKEPGEVGQAARALVYKWKSMVAAEESDQEGDHDTKTYNGNGKDSDDYTKQHRIKQEQNVKPNISSVNVKTEDYKQMNGNHSGSKRKHQTNEEEKSTLKRSKYSSSSDNDDYKRKPDIQIKKELSDSESDTDDSQSESDSEYSESSREEIKVKQEVKVEPTDKHKSSSSKHQSHSNNVEQKRDSSASKKSHETSEKHSSTHSHSSRSKEKYSPEKSSSKEKSQSTHRHESSKEKDDSIEKKQRTEPKSSHTEKEQKESKSSSKHSSSDKHKSSSRKSESSAEKHESNNDKHVSKSEKHKSHSHNSEKEKHKSSSEKEISTHKHKTKDSSVSNSSKDKHSSSSKDKSQDRSSSSKEKSSSHSEKKHSSSKDSKSHRSDNKSQSDKGEDKNSEKKSKHKSSSSSSKGSKSSTKSKEDEPKKKAKSASFAEALGMMLSPTKPKKKLLLKDSQSPNNSFSNDLSPAALLAPSAKLAPLPALEISALPEISPNYKPRPPPKLLAHLNDEEAMCASISSKNQRTKVYSGNKVLGKIPTLYEMCVQILQEHIDALEYTGGVPYEILKPVVDKATPQQLFLLEHYNPYLMEDTDHLWQKFCEKHFRNKHRQEMETCREMYIRCQEEQENRLKSLTANIRMTQEAKKAPIKQTKMAYVDSVVKPPRNVARKQAVHGTAHAASASPAARVASLAAAPNVLRPGRHAPAPSPASALASTLNKPKKAPLMAKALQLMRGRKR